MDAGERILVGGQGTHVQEYTEDGRTCAEGIVPHVIASGAGAVQVSGTGRIIQASSPSGRPAWREALNP